MTRTLLLNLQNHSPKTTEPFFSSFRTFFSISRTIILKLHKPSPKAPEPLFSRSQTLFLKLQNPSPQSPETFSFSSEIIPFKLQTHSPKALDLFSSSYRILLLKLKNHFQKIQIPSTPISENTFSTHSVLSLDPQHKPCTLCQVNPEKNEDIGIVLIEFRL